MESQKSWNGSFLSTHEREKGWYLSGDAWLYKCQGFWFSESLLESILSVPQSPHSNLSSSHTLICNHPKCGTTWLKALTFAIATRSRYQCPLQSPLLTSNPHTLIPYLESPPRSIQDRDSPLFSTHMPYACLPKWVLESGCKILYICRDPKDILVSRWHFCRKLRPNNDSNAPHIPLEQAFDLFYRGLSASGPFWDHVLEYWKASLEHPDKILFFRYESMMRDPISHLVSLAKFMGYPFSNEEEVEGLPLKIVEMCSFESLSNLEVNKSEKKDSMFGNNFSNDVFFRKGKIGDWRNYLTQEMADKIDRITEMKLGPHGLRL